MKKSLLVLLAVNALTLLVAGNASATVNCRKAGFAGSTWTCVQLSNQASCPTGWTMGACPTADRNAVTPNENTLTGNYQGFYNGVLQSPSGGVNRENVAKLHACLTNGYSSCQSATYSQCFDACSAAHAGVCDDTSCQSWCTSYASDCL